MPAVIIFLVIGYFIFSSGSFWHSLGGVVVFVFFVISVATSFIFPPVGVFFGTITYILGLVFGYWK